MHDAGAALARVAADMRAGQAEMLPQQLHQQGAPFDCRRCRLAVNGEAHRFLHGILPDHIGRAVFCRGRGEFRAPPRLGQGASRASGTGVPSALSRAFRGRPFLEGDPQVEGVR